MGRPLLFLFLAGLFAQIPSFALDEGVPSVPVILSNVVKRSEQVAAATNIWLHYNRHALLHQLGSKEQIESKTKKEYWMVVGNGQTQSVLLSVDGKPVGDDKKDKDQHEGRKEFAITHKLLSKYAFEFERAEMIEGRKCQVLKFHPQPDLEDDGMLDKILNRLAGTIWVDSEEFEVAKIDVRLQTPASFFGGFAGSVSKLRLTLLKRKVTPEYWTNESVFIEMQGRKVLSGFHFRAWEQSSDFTILPDPYSVVAK